MTDGATPPRPIGPSERIDAIDVLRGLALLGVVAMNVVTQFRVSIFEQFLFPKPPLSPIDSAVETILMLAVDLKALALFSLLFGAGLAIQFERLARSERRTLLLVRRLVVLLAFGLIHLCLIWNGDILTEYALAGLSSCRSCLVRAGYWLSPRWRLSGCTLRCRPFRRRDCGPARPRWGRMSLRRIASTRRAASSTCWRSGSARFPFSLPCTSISFRARSGCFFSAHSPGAPAFCETRHAICCSRSPPPVSALARH